MNMRRILDAKRLRHLTLSRLNAPHAISGTSGSGTGESGSRTLGLAQRCGTLVLLALLTLHPLLAQIGLDPPKTDGIETIIVELGPNGFFPSRIERKSTARFRIFVRVGIPRNGLALRLETQEGGVLRQVEPTRLGTRWTELIDVPSGKYSVRVPGRPNLSLDIVVP